MSPFSTSNSTSSSSYYMRGSDAYWDAAPVRERESTIQDRIDTLEKRIRKQMKIEKQQRKEMEKYKEPHLFNPMELHIDNIDKIMS